MALGYSISAIISILSKCEFINLNSDEINNITKSLKTLIKDFSIEKPAKENIAKNLSLKLKNKIPVIVSSEHLIGSSHSFKNFLNENGYNVSYSTLQYGYDQAKKLIEDDPDFKTMVTRIQENDN